MRRSAPDEPTYLSFFLLGGTWIIQFCITFIFTIADSGKHLNGEIGSGLLFGIAHLVVLLIGAWEDLRYNTHHLKGIIILAVFMNFIMNIIAYLGMLAIVAVVVAVLIGGGLLAIGGEAVAGFLIGYTAAGGSIGTILMVLLIIGSIISGMIGMSAVW